jgi:glycosyltransferase involved in cell wall biosynthesis
MAARFNPQKDFEVLMAAAAGLMNRHPDLHMLLCGPGIGPENRELADVASAAGCGSRLHLMGLRDDMPRWQAALDVATLASHVEGIPNTIGEAMACGVPCVVTDVGGAGELVGRDGKAGRLVPIRDAVAFETAIDGLLSLPAEARRQIGAEARRRIAERFSIETMVERFEATWTEILSQQHSTQTRQAA